MKEFLAPVVCTLRAVPLDMRGGALLSLLLLACNGGQLTRTDLEPERPGPVEDDGGWPSVDGGVVMPEVPADAGDEAPGADGGVPPTVDAGPPEIDAGPETPTDLPPGYGPVEGLELVGLEMYQTLRVPLVESGAVVARNLPLLANKPSLLRVFVRPAAGWSPRAVKAFVRIEANGGVQTFDAEATVSGASTVETASSTLNVILPREALAPGASVSVTLAVPGGTGGDLARFPRDGGLLDLELSASGTLDVVIVPIRYDADGSGRMPDISDQALEALRQHLLSMWPVTEVNFRVRDAVGTSNAIAPSSGQAWSNLLGGLGNLRQSDGAAPEEYYLGLVAPAPTYRDFCRSGCIAGIAPLNTRNAQSQRYGLTLHYGDESTRFTAIHELGHAHGRPHAPCGGAAGAEASYPHAGGNTGVWGYDFRNRTLHNPTTKDFMGYCNPQWVSDWSYLRLRERVVAVTGTRTLSDRVAPHHVFQLAPFQAPRWAGLFDEALTEADDETVMMRARDAFGRPLGWVAARRVELSVPGFANLLVPDVEGAAHFETASGASYEVRSTSASVLYH
ncbi:MAG: hypothetical protein KF901_07135 [Myxococcales bacterium]|nr:hypothetical protein [Myxococcales bacterium]